MRNTTFRLVDLTGMRFGRLVALSVAPPRGDKVTRWLCRCDCGVEVEVRQYNLRSKNGSCTRSCGCLVRESSIENGRKRRERRAAMGTSTNNAPHDAAEGAGA